ncbi:MAG TPA: hypothetical protein VFQ22_09005, partial [Longimicrobiales bacterium]|nr:hypothetical protein [Longimicrobiales bacterium]
MGFRDSLGRAGLRLLGAALLVLAFAPLYRVMDLSAESPFREVSVRVADATLQVVWWGTLVTVLLAAVLAVLVPAGRLRAAASAAAERVARPPRPLFALAAGAIATGIACLVAYTLYRGFFTNVDEIASTLHARYLAQGRLSGPALERPEFWLVPNMLMVPEGWVSQYPPTHLLALALVNRLGIPVLLGPLSFGAMVALLALSLERLLPEEPALARIAAAAVAASPLLFFLGGGSMNHVTAGALLAAALYAALRARDGSAA